MVTSNIFKLFGRSPIRPLQRHMSISLECAEQLPLFVSASQQEDWDAAEKIQHMIVDLENQADKVKQDIRGHLPKTLFMPVPREDILELLTMQDKLPNRVKDIAGLMLGRRMRFPKEIAGTYQHMLTCSIDCTRQIHLAINEIDQLLETGFREDEIELIENLITNVSKVEQETDNLQIQVRLQLFQIESQLSPIDVMFLYQVIELTSDIADRAEQIGERLQLLLAR